MNEDKGEGLAIAGWILIMLGIVGALLGLFAYDPSVEVGYTATSYGLPDRVLNASRANMQNNIVLLSGVVFLAGNVLWGCAGVARAVQGGVAAMPAAPVSPTDVPATTTPVGVPIAANAASPTNTAAVVKAEQVSDAFIYWCVGGFVALLVGAFALASALR